MTSKKTVDESETAISKLKAFIQELAEAEPIRKFNIGGPMSTGAEEMCRFCDYHSDAWQGKGRTQHYPDCVWTKANSMIQGN